jgi:LPXTG-motif cell wall-anchored protein
VSLKVNGNQTANFTAIGAALHGPVGTVVTANVGVVNRGPARRDWGRWGEPVQSLKVVIPNGTTAVAVPPTCHSWAGNGSEHTGEPGARTYLCRAHQYEMDVHETLSFPIRLRIDSSAQSRGSVTVNLEPGNFGHRMPDLKPSDDAAALIVNGPAPTGDTGSGAAQLPVTGAPVAAITVIGASLVLLGVAGVAAVRRRRGTRLA